jgi:hypothetical protein
VTTTGCGIEKPLVMPRVRDTISVVRAAAIWLLMLSVFLDPAGWRAASAFGRLPSMPCEVSCPCDEAPHEDDDCDDEHDEHDDGRADEHDDDDEQCPDGCTSCSCGPGVAMTMMAVTLPTRSLPSSPERMLVQMDAPTSGVRSGVFRPPRSLS